MVIYMPMILELPIAMLACTRIGAVHSVVVSKGRNNGINAKGRWIKSIEGKKDNVYRSSQATRPTRWRNVSSIPRLRS